MRLCLMTVDGQEPPLYEHNKNAAPPTCLGGNSTSHHKPLILPFSLVLFWIQRHSAWDGCSTYEVEVKPKNTKQKL